MRLLKWLANLLAVLTVSLATMQASYASAISPRLLVVYPQINPSYDAIFQEIVTGIKKHPKAEYVVFPIKRDTPVEEIHQLIKKEEIDAIIALGKQTYNFSSKYQINLPVVHGGLLLTPNGRSGISLTGSPDEFFAHLESYAPKVKRVYTVYSEANSGWLIELAKEASKERNIELIAYPANDMREAVKKFKGILDQTEGPNDAIWMLLDNILPDKTVMPTALEVAWRRRVVLISNNPSHTKRGALFSLFPDHQEMGYSLVDLAIRKVSHPGGSPLLEPLQNMKISLNRRTASHLGFHYSKDLEEQLDLVYPTR